jgi:hypothetical protein
MVDVVGSSPSFDHCTFSNGFTTLIQCSTGTNQPNPVIHYSSILSSTTVYGVNNTSTAVTIDATQNWWGNATGPYDPSPGPPSQNNGGLGSKVSDYVAYDPWMTAAPNGSPVIAVKPSSLWEGSPSRTQITASLQVNNLGGGDLYFQISEAQSSGTATASLATSESVDLMWLDESPKFGRVPASDSTFIAVTFDGSVVPDARYDGYLILQSNDGAQSPLAIPVHFFVGNAALDVHDPGAGSAFGITNIFPVPTQGGLTLSVQLPSGDSGTLSILDIAGRVLKKTHISTAGGTAAVVWDGRDDEGTSVSPGVYFLQLRQGARLCTKRFCVAR